MWGGRVETLNSSSPEELAAELTEAERLRFGDPALDLDLAVDRDLDRDPDLE